MFDNLLKRIEERPLRYAMIVIWSLVLLLVVALGVIAGITTAHAAPTVTITATPSSQISPADVKLDWTATEVSTCNATGGWAGVKATSGTETIPGVKGGTTTFGLTCSAASGSATLSWTAPTQNTDNTPLTDLAGYKVYSSTDPAKLATSTPVTADKAATGYVYAALSAGTWYFGVRASNSKSVDSDMAGPVQKVVTLPSASGSTSVTLQTQPQPPGGFVVVQTVAYEIKFHPVQGTILGRDVGTVALGTKCGDDPVVWTSEGIYRAVPYDAVALSKSPKSQVLVALCAPPG